MAIGVVVSQQPAGQETETWLSPYANGSSFSQGLLSTGIVLTIFELARHSLILLQQRTKLVSPLQLTIIFMACLRLVIALSMASLLLYRMLLNRGLVDTVKHEDLVQFYSGLWPDLLLIVLLVLSMRLMLRPRKKLSRSFPQRLISGTIISVGILCVSLYILTDRLLVSFLVHLAIDGVEKSHAFLWQRPEVFPNHLAERYWSFWSSFWATCLVGVAVVSLLFGAKVKSRWRLSIIWSTFVICVAVVAGYVWWFVTSEFPRLNPELAGAPSPLLWSDVLAGLILLFGLGAVCGYQLARQRSEQSSKVISRPAVSGLMAIGAVAIAVSTGYDWLSMFVESMSNPFWGLPLDNWLFEKIATVMQLILDLEMMVPLAALLSACTIVWQFFKPLDSVEQIQLVSGWQVAGYSLAVILLLVVAVPCLAAFGFCYWLGPWVL